MKMMYSLFGLILLFAFILQSCSTTQVTVSSVYPAQVNIAKYKKVYIGDFSGHRGAKEVQAALTSALVNDPNLSNIYDMQSLERILFENHLVLSGVLEGEGAKTLKSLVGDAALITGFVSAWDYKEDITKGDPYEDKEGKKHVKFTRNAWATVSVTFKIIDLVNGNIIFSRPFERRTDYQTTAVDSDPPGIDRKHLLNQANIKLINSFWEMLVPHRKYYDVTMYRPEEVPEMETGVAFAEAGSWDKAINVFRDLTLWDLDPVILSQVYYNLGISYQYNYEFQSAIESFEKAISYYDNNKYIHAIQNCRIMEENYRIYQEHANEIAE